MATKRLYWGMQTVYSHATFPAEWARLTGTTAAAPSWATIGGQQWTATANTFAAIQPLADDILAQGAYPILDWFTSASASPPVNMCNPAILAGAQDAYIDAWAAAAAAWNKPIILCFNFEMNGNWYVAYSDIATAQGNYAGSHKAMWQYVHDRFVAQGATKVAWMWIVNNQSKNGSGSATAQTTQPLSQFYPGDSYVDIIGMDCFNYGGGGSGLTTTGGANWMSAEEIMGTSTQLGDTWTNLAALGAGTAPICVASFGCDSREGKDTNALWATNPIANGTKKGQWWTDFGVMLKDPKYARLAGWRYYNVDHASIAPPYTYGYSLNQNDSAVESPTSAAVGGVHTSPVSPFNVETYTVTGAGQQLTAFRAVVADPSHLKGAGAFTLSTGKPVFPYLDGSDTYGLAETAIGASILELRLGEGTKTNTSLMADTSGNALNGTYNGATCVDVAGLTILPVNSALQIDGASYGLVPDNNLLSTQVTSAMWISFWYQISILPVATMALVCKGSGSGTWEYVAALTTTGLAATWFQLSGTSALASTASFVPALNVRHRIDMAIDPTLPNGTTDKAIVYHDGVRVVGGTTVAGSMANGTSGLYIGRRGDGSQPAGTVGNPIIIDEVHIRSGFPTAQQVLSLWYQGSGVASGGTHQSSGD